jgi:GNAT superfamily N-acetyltransferase
LLENRVSFSLVTLIRINSVKPTFEIRQSTAPDWRALRLLLPEAVHFGSTAMAIIAEETETRRIAGAIAVDAVLRTEPEVGARVAIHVVPPSRNRGVESQLLDAAETIARSRGARALYTWGCIDAGGDVARFWEQLGFDRAVHVLEGRTDVAAGLRYLEPFWQQLHNRGKVPTNIRSVSTDQADPLELARMYVAHIGGRFEAIYPRLTGESPISFDPNNSTVILLDDKIVGLGLARPVASGVALVEAIIVDPQHRGRWTNLYLKRESWRRCQAAGTHTVIYHTQDRHQDTRRFVEKAGTVVRDLVEPYRMLAT